MTDASASSVIFHNQGGFDCNFSVQWDGGETDRTNILSIGQTTTLEYVTTFRYPTPPPRELRRAATRTIENVDIRVEFDPAKMPSQLWWTVWKDLDGPVISREPVTLDAGNSAERYLRRLQSSVIGFTWEW